MPRAGDPATAEVAAALTCVTFSTAAVLGLAVIIRQANGFDRPAIAKELPPVIAAEPTAAAASQAAPAAVSYADVEKVRSWIAEWRSKTEAIEAAAAAATAAAEAEAAATAAKQTETDPAEVQKVQGWIANWRALSAAAASAAAAPVAIAMKASGETVGTTRVTEPSLPTSATKADPAAAAAVLEALSADAPVGITAAPKAAEPTEGELVMAAVAAPPAPTAPKDDALEAARNYEERLNKVLSGSTVAEPAEVKAKRAQRVVTISEQYQAKIDSLLSNFVSKKAEEAVLLAKTEKLTMDLAALDNEQKLRPNPIAVMAQRLVEIVRAIWVFFLALVARVTGGRFGSGSGATA